MLNSEFKDVHLGCCVSPRVEAYFALDNASGGGELKAWAAANACEFQYEQGLRQTWVMFKGILSVPAPAGRFAIVSCKRDA